MSKNHLTLSMGESDSNESHGVLTAPVRPDLQKPSMYQVIMLNDDFTPMDFVIEVLTTFFSMDLEKASQIMLAVHTQGKAVCGVYTKDIAETKAALVIDFAKNNQHPLMCDVQKVN